MIVFKWCDERSTRVYIKCSIEYVWILGGTYKCNDYKS